MEILHGKPVSDEILVVLKKNISEQGIAPGLAVILIGNDKASRIYVNLKRKKAKEANMNFFLFQFSIHDDELDIIEKIKILNEDNQINGIIVQVPLPEKFDTQRIIDAIDPKKDVDGFHPESIEKFKQGNELFWPVFPKAIIILLESSGEDLLGKKAVAIVNSIKFGDVMVSALEKKGMAAQFILSDEIADGLAKIGSADIVVTAVGVPGLLNGGIIKKGAILIDGGITEENSRVIGDVNLESVNEVASYVSPVPGGVGPVTIACLLENVYIAYQNQGNEL